MKKISSKYWIIYVMLFLLVPTFVFADDDENVVERYKLALEKADITSHNTSYPDGYKEVLYVSDYIYIKKNREGIAKLNKNLEVLDNLNLEGYNYPQVVNGNIYNVQVKSNYSNGTNTYYLTFFKYNENFKLQLEKEIKTFSNNVAYNIRYKYYQNNHYITYQGGSTYYLMVLDKDGNVLSDTSISSNIKLDYYSYELVILNDKLYLMTPTYDNGYKSEFYTIEKNGSIAAAKTINNYEITEIIQDKNDNYAAIGYYSDGEAYILKLDKNFKIIAKTNFASSINDSSIELNEEKIYRTNNSYIILGRTKASQNKYKSKSVILIYDNNLKYQYSLNYSSDLVEANGNGNSDIYIDGNTLYVASTIGYDGYTPDSGSLILKYVLDAYNIKTEVVGGKGNINSNLDTALPGEKVTFSIVPEKGYEVKRVTVYTEEGEEIKFTNNSFTMPEVDVIIKVEFIKNETNPNTSIGISITIVIFLVASCIIAIKIYIKKNWLKG